MGSGKSRIGRELSVALGWEFIDLDRYIEHKIGKSIPEIFSEGEEHFRAVEAEAVRDVITMREITGESLVLALGGGTLMTGSIRELILEHTCCVYLQTGLDEIIKRLGTRSKSRPLFNGKYEIESLLDSRIPTYELAGYAVSTDGKTPEMVTSEILAFIIP